MVDLKKVPDNVNLTSKHEDFSISVLSIKTTVLEQILSLPPMNESAPPN